MMVAIEKLFNTSLESQNMTNLGAQLKSKAT